jgi:hypothetical protein
LHRIVFYQNINGFEDGKYIKSVNGKGEFVF